MTSPRWTRRKLLELAVAVPAVAVVACDPVAPPGTNGSPDGSIGGPGPDGGALQDGGAGDAGLEDAGLDGGMDADAGQDAGEVEEHTCTPELPRIDLKMDCGAAGDGVTNDTAALQKAADLIQQAGGGELVIPPGVYIVGRQTVKPSSGAPGPWYREEKMFEVADLSCLRISGFGATLKIADGLHYGGFNPTTGAAQDYTSGNANAAKVGRVIQISGSKDVLIEGLEIDGNNEKLILGGQWGDVDIQASATGVWLNMCENVRVVDVHTHHHGLDGITVLYLQGAPPRKMPHKLLRVTSAYNGRQAISWIGGWGLECTDCKFNHTGRAMNGGQPMVSKPRAGLDIEPNGGTSQRSLDGLFTRCEFIDNAGAGIVTAGADGGYSTFVDCTIWGTTSYSLWITKPGLKFVNCRIHGTAVHASDGHTGAGADPNPALATTFEDCTFEDKPWTNGKVFRSGYLYNLNEGKAGVTFKRCTFINHQVRGVYMGDATNVERFEACTFVHSNPGLSNGTYQSRFEGSHLRSCLFQESTAVKNSGRSFYISVTGVVVEPPATGGAPTHVDGPQVKWNSASTGATGDIAPGTYS